MSIEVFDDCPWIDKLQVLETKTREMAMNEEDMLILRAEETYQSIKRNTSPDKNGQPSNANRVKYITEIQTYVSLVSYIHSCSFFRNKALYTFV